MQKSQFGLLQSLLHEYCVLSVSCLLIKEAMEVGDIHSSVRLRACHNNEALSQCHELIPIALPERWHEYQLYNHNLVLLYNSADWTHVELSRAFKRLVTQDILPAKFCFLIDGLDEYGGDPAVIVALFRDIPPSSSINICVSSCPIVVCKEAFDQGLMLMLQDLTY